MNSGRTVLAQLFDLLPRRAYAQAVARYAARERAPAMSCMDQLLCMAFAQLTGRSSLRETITCLRAIGVCRYHCGIRCMPARSTLADANERRDHRIFMDAALSMIRSARLELPVDPDLRRLNIRAAFAVDSTTIDLCLALFPWALFRKRKGGVKAHVMLDLRVGSGGEASHIPVFMRVSHAKTSDVSILDLIPFAAGAYYVLDKGYIDFARLYRIQQARAFFVTRAKRDMVYRVIQRRPVTPGGPVTHDQVIRLRGPKSRKFFPEPLRRIRYVDAETGKRLTFLTNHLTLDAATIALSYRKRWRIELLFKWMKQHLHIKAFFGTTPNAVKTQLWIAVMVLVMIHRLKQQEGLTQTPYEIAQILSVTLCGKTPINQAFLDTSKEIVGTSDHNQLTLFDL